jgi:hypothetical protein
LARHTLGPRHARRVRLADLPVLQVAAAALRSIRRREKRVEVVLASDGTRLEHTDFVAAESLEEFPYVLSEPLGVAFAQAGCRMPC